MDHSYRESAYRAPLGENPFVKQPPTAPRNFYREAEYSERHHQPHRSSHEDIAREHRYHSPPRNASIRDEKPHYSSHHENYRPRTDYHYQTCPPQTPPHTRAQYSRYKEPHTSYRSSNEDFMTPYTQPRRPRSPSLIVRRHETYQPIYNDARTPARVPRTERRYTYTVHRDVLLRPHSPDRAIYHSSPQSRHCQHDLQSRSQYTRSAMTPRVPPRRRTRSPVNHTCRKNIFPEDNRRDDTRARSPDRYTRRSPSRSRARTQSDYPVHYHSRDREHDYATIAPPPDNEETQSHTDPEDTRCSPSPARYSRRSPTRASSVVHCQPKTSAPRYSSRVDPINEPSDVIQDVRSKLQRKREKRKEKKTQMRLERARTPDAPNSPPSVEQPVTTRTARHAKPTQAVEEPREQPKLKASKKRKRADDPSEPIATPKKRLSKVARTSGSQIVPSHPSMTPARSILDSDRVLRSSTRTTQCSRTLVDSSDDESDWDIASLDEWQPSTTRKRTDTNIGRAPKRGENTTTKSANKPRAKPPLHPPTGKLKAPTRNKNQIPPPTRPTKGPQRKEKPSKRTSYKTSATPVLDFLLGEKVSMNNSTSVFHQLRKKFKEMKQNGRDWLRSVDLNGRKCDHRINAKCGLKQAVEEAFKRKDACDPRYQLEDDLEIIVLHNKESFPELTDCEFFGSAECRTYNYFERCIRADGIYMPPSLALPNYRRAGPAVVKVVIDTIIKAARAKVTEPREIGTLGSKAKTIDILRKKLVQCFGQPLQGHNTSSATPGLAKSIEQHLRWFVKTESKHYRDAENGMLLSEITEDERKSNGGVRKNT